MSTHRCPICNLDISQYDDEKRWSHVNKCLLDQENNASLQPVLTKTQETAISICNRRAQIFSSAVTDHVTSKLVSLGYSENDLPILEKYFETKVRFVIHIRIENALQHILKDEFYRNLFEVGRSGGATNQYARKAWEDNLFNRVYANSPGWERVKYCALNLTCDAMGSPAIGYGESFMVIRREVHDRISFCVGDSSRCETHMATFKYPLIVFNLISRDLLKELLDLAKTGKRTYPSHYMEYLEGQIHGPVSIKRDIESLHVPKRYQHNADIMQKLSEFVKLYNIPIIFYD